jgi:hypothetical protein
MGWIDTDPLGRELVSFPELYIESFDINVPMAMRPLFNVLWNAFGFVACDMYGGDGRWRGQM